MFEASAVVTAAVDRVYEAMGDYDRGEIVAYSVIESACGFDRDTRHWGALIRRLRHRLHVERDLTIEFIPNIGAKLQTVRETLIVQTNRRRRKQMSQSRKATKELVHLPVAEMSEFEAMMRTRQIEQFQRTRLDVLRHERVMRHLLRQPEGV